MRGYTTNTVAILGDCQTYSNVNGHHWHTLSWSSRWSDQWLSSKAQYASGAGVRIM